MTDAREYFPGCHDMPLDLALEPTVCRYCGNPLAYIGADQDNGPEAMKTKCWGRYVDHSTDGPTLADAVHAAEQRRIVDGGQLTLPAELMPIPAGALFA